MICTICGGQVTWKGPITALTHTSCNSCGAANSQAHETVECENCEGKGVVEEQMRRSDGVVFDVDSCCPECEGDGVLSG